ncbi:hypothetical protein [Nonomuraea sp. NPDC048826]|uniref:hypothetical protein n=1 Tax=Nonomuraea sp. NPDC048826 TaxID=3364347 RepID=UPI00371EC4FE
MRRSLRTVLTLAAASAATAVVMGSPASADPQPLIADPPVKNWGSYYSSNFKAKAKGTLKTHWNPAHSKNDVRIKGKLYDLDFRTLQQGGKCAYVQIKVHHLYQPYWKWDYAKSYKLCNAGQVKHFTFWKHNVDKVRIRVSQIGKYSNNVVKRGPWHQINV